MTKMRAIIAKRMVESKHTSAHVHTVFKVDMTRIVKLREKEKNKYEQRNGVKLTYMPFITRAAVQALRKHPIVNASTQGDAILYNKNINIGIAVALEWGLIVPVIKQTEEKSFLGIARAIVDLADRARNKKLAPDEVAGGTFTLTNSGIFGEQFGTPIIAQPQSAILGIGGLNKEPMVLTDKDGNDSIAIRCIQRFTLGFDHRIIDGADAGKFMSRLQGLPRELDRRHRLSTSLNAYNNQRQTPSSLPLFLWLDRNSQRLQIRQHHAITRLGIGDELLDVSDHSLIQRQRKPLARNRRSRILHDLHRVRTERQQHRSRLRARDNQPRLLRLLKIGRKLRIKSLQIIAHR